MKKYRLLALLCCVFVGTGMAYVPSASAAKFSLKKSPAAPKNKSADKKKKNNH